MPQNFKTVFALTAVLLMCASFAFAYPENYLSAKLGASVSSPAQIMEGNSLDAILSDGPVSKGEFSFADVQQKQVFIVDLGQERTFDRMHFGTDNKGAPRMPKSIKIEASSQGIEGPYQTILEKSDLGWFQVLRLPLTTARWIRFDFGEGATGAKVRNIRIYKGYEHPKLEEVTKILHGLIKPGLPGLEKFYAAADAGDWAKACTELRNYYATKFPMDEDPPNPKTDLTRAEDHISGNLDYAGFTRYEKVPIDWSYQATTDWYEHKNFLNRGARIGSPIDALYHTGDKKWLDEFRSVFYDWEDANPKPTVMSGADYPPWRTLDSACREAWFTTRFGKLTAVRAAEDELWANVLYSIWEHADYLKGDNFTGGNWLAMTTSAVMDIAINYPEFKDQTDWFVFSKDAYEKNVLRDVYPDGKETEDAPGYVCMAYAGMFRTLQALEKAGIQVDPETRNRLNKTQDFLGAVTQPDGNMPAIGDWGGGEAWVLPGIWPYFNREDIHYILSKGKEGVKPSFTSINFPDGGWSVMRSSYDEKPYKNARHLVFKSSSGSHGHLDIFNITNYAYGRPLLIDPSIRSYEGADVDRYLHTSYHNTICVDGKSQSRGGGKTEKWVSNTGIDYVFGTSEAYKSLVHHRNVVFVKPEYWIVHDDIVGKGSHTYDQNWHFNEDAGLVEDPATKAVHTSYFKGGNLLMVPVNSSSLKSEQTKFFIATERLGEYGQIESRGWKYSKTGSTPQVFDMVLYPYSGGKAPNISVKSLVVEGTNPTDVTALEVKIGNKTDYVFISRAGPRKIVCPAAKIVAYGEVVLLRLKDGKPIRLSGTNISEFGLNGKWLYSQEVPAVDVDIVLK